MNARQIFLTLRARWLLIVVTLLMTVGATVLVSVLLPKRYTATATVVLDFKGVDPVSGAILPVLSLSGYLATQLDIIQSHSVARKAVDQLKLVENPSAKDLFSRETGGRGNIRDWLAELLLKYLTVEPSRESSVIKISYTGNDPRFSAAVANAFVSSYINTNLELKVAPARQTNAFFNEQIRTLKSQLEASQSRLSEYQRSKGIIATEERLDVESNRLNELSTQVLQAQAQTYDSLARQRQVEEVIARGQVPETIPDVLSNPVIQGLKANLTALEVKQNDLTSKVGKNHPAFLANQAEIESVRRNIIEEMRTISRTLANAASLAQKREEQLRNALAVQRTKVLEMKNVRDELTVLMREGESAQRAYDAAMGRMTQTNLESQTPQTNVMVINEAVEPLEPSSPKIVLNTVLAIILGLMLGIGFALLREMTDRVIRTAADMADTTGMTVLGVLGSERRWRRGRFMARPASQAA